MWLIVAVLPAGLGVYIGATLGADARSWIKDVGPTAVTAAGVLAAAAAGVTAWIAVQRQINAAEDLATRPERSARNAFCDGLSDLLGLVDIAWEKADQALSDTTDDRRLKSILTIFTVKWHIERQLKQRLPTLRLLTSEMSFADRRAAETSIEFLDEFAATVRQGDQKYEAGQLAGKEAEKLFAVFVRVAATQLYEALRRFDESLLGRFQNRVKAEVEWTPITESLDSLRDIDWPDHIQHAAAPGASSPQASQPGRAQRALSSIFGRFGK
ncbi:MAG TPA: hypothetical protein VNX29_02000 [Kaistia sp.]|nr:hypothetical protein [Kaistia sp.]